MISNKFSLRPMAVAALVLACGASQAALTVITTQAGFDAAVVNKGTDTYTGFSISGVTISPFTRTTSVGTAYSYTGAAPGDFFGAGTTANPWLSTNTATDSITFSGFSGGVRAIGGNFFGSDIAGLFLAGSVTLVATDSLGATSTQTITGATVSSFLGYVSTGTITSLTVTAVQGVNPLWPTVDNLQLAVVAVPEPGTYALMLAGLGFVGFMARRRAS